MKKELFDKWEMLVEILGEDKMLLEIFSYLSSDTVDDFINTTCTNWDIEMEVGLDD